MFGFITRIGRRWFASIPLGQALTLFDKGKLEYATAELQRTLRIYPQHEKAFYHLGRIYSKQGRHAEAVEAFDRVIELRPEFAPAFMGRGLSRLELRQVPEAVSDCERAVALKKDYQNLIALGSAFAAAKRYDEAEQTLQEAQRLKPKEAAACAALGECFYEQGKFQQAAEALTKACAIDAKDADTLSMLGMCLEAMGDLKGAMARYTKASFLDPKNAMHCCRAAHTAELQGDPEGAAISYQEALRIDPECSEALYQLSRLLRDHDPEKARGYAERLARAFPEKWEGHFELAVILASLGEEKEALSALKEAVERDKAAVTAAAEKFDFSALKGGYKFKNLLS